MPTATPDPTDPALAEAKKRLREAATCTGSLPVCTRQDDLTVVLDALASERAQREVAQQLLGDEQGKVQRLYETYCRDARNLHAEKVRADAAVEEVGRLRGVLAGAEKVMTECGVLVQGRAGEKRFCVYCDWPLDRPWPGGPSIVGTIIGHRDMCPLLAVRAAIAPPTPRGVA